MPKRFNCESKIKSTCCLLVQVFAPLPLERPYGQIHSFLKSYPKCVEYEKQLTWAFFPPLHPEPWELFMLRYSELHPQEVDTLSPHRAMPHKRGRGEGTGDVGEMKKLKVSSDDTGLEESQSEQVAERRPPVVLFTGISQSAVKKLKTVSMCARIWILALYC